MGWKDSKKQRSREAEGLVTELWSQRIVTIYWLCCQLCYETVANQRTSVEIELLATMSWTCGCQPLSCPCSQNVMHGQKEICPAWWTCLSKVPIPTRSLRPLSLQKIESRHPRFGLQDIDCDLSCLIDATAASQWRIVEIHLLASAGWKRGCEPFGCRCSQHVTTCLFHESIPAIPFWNSKHSLPLWEPQHAPPALHYCIIPKFVFTINWLCSSVTTADTAFSLRGLEAGLWAFRPPMFTTCDDMLFRNPFPLFLFWIPSMFQEFIPAIPFWISKHPIIPIPTRSLRLLRATATLPQLCIVVASCPSLRCSYRKKPVSCREAKGLVTELCSPRFLTYNTVIVSKIWITGHWWCSQLWHVAAANQWNSVSNCRDWQDWDFSIRGLEVGLPAFQLPMFSKCDAMTKGDLLDMFV